MRNTYITTAVIAAILAVAPEMCRAQVIKSSDLEKYSKVRVKPPLLLVGKTFGRRNVPLLAAAKTFPV